MQKLYWLLFIIVAFGAGFYLVQYSKNITQDIPIVLEWQKPPKTTTDILFVGDIMLDRAVRVIIKKDGIESVFAGVRELFSSADKVVANLEGVFSDNKSIAGSRSPLRFTFDPELAPSLSILGIDIVSQANNHALDFGTDGLAQSTSTLIASGIAWFGDYTNANPSPYTFVSNGNKITLIGYHEFSYKNTDKILEAIESAKSSGSFVVVVPHWGVEYEFLPSTLQKRMAHSFIDVGADAVIGGHPHVLQPIEVYRGRAIFYSIGNFVFDQWFQDDVMQPIAVRMHLSKDDISYSIIPIFVDHAKPTVAGLALREAILNKISVGSYVGESERQQIASGSLILKR